MLSCCGCKERHGQRNGVLLLILPKLVKLRYDILRSIVGKCREEFALTTYAAVQSQTLFSFVVVEKLHRVVLDVDNMSVLDRHLQNTKKKYFLILGDFFLMVLNCDIKPDVD